MIYNGIILRIDFVDFLDKTIARIYFKENEFGYFPTFWTTIVVRNYRDNCEKQCCPGSHKQCKTLFKDHMVRLKIISLYIYKDLRLRSNESRDHCHEAGNLVPSPRCGFCFEAAFQL